MRKIKSWIYMYWFLFVHYCLITFLRWLKSSPCHFQYVSAWWFKCYFFLYPKDIITFIKVYFFIWQPYPWNFKKLNESIAIFIRFYNVEIFYFAECSCDSIFICKIIFNTIKVVFLSLLPDSVLLTAYPWIKQKEKPTVMWVF